MAFALNYIFVPSLFLHYSKFPVSISSGVALWVKKVKTTQTDREFKRSSASRGEVLRATAEGKSTLPLHSNCIYITVNTQILPVWKAPLGSTSACWCGKSADFALGCPYPWSVSLEIHIISCSSVWQIICVPSQILILHVLLVALKTSCQLWPLPHRENCERKNKSRKQKLSTIDSMKKSASALLKNKTFVL